jgi:phosphopantothenoylcysteine decarboxylase
MRVLLGVTGSVAAGLMPKLANALIASGHDVQIIMTKSARYFHEPDNLSKKIPWWNERDPRKIPEAKEWSQVRVWTDENEWFRRFTRRIIQFLGRYGEQSYQKDDPILHVDLRKWADVLVVAPLSANTLAKMSVGMCDNLLTCVFRAWDFDKPVIFAPAMNTFMWSNPWTDMQINILSCLQGASGGYHVRFVEPQRKVLACGDEGVGAMADISKIVDAVNKLDKTKTAQAAALTPK